MKNDLRANRRLRPVRHRAGWARSNFARSVGPRMSSAITRGSARAIGRQVSSLVAPKGDIGPRSLQKQDKAFLREVMVMRQDLMGLALAHRDHRHAVRQAVSLVQSRAVELQPGFQRQQWSVESDDYLFVVQDLFNRMAACSRQYAP